MANTKPEVEWFYDPNSFTTYGVMCLAGKWAVVKEPAFGDPVVVTEWLDDRKTAVGLLKLLKEK